MTRKKVSVKGTVKKRYFFRCVGCERYTLLKAFSRRFDRRKVKPCRHCGAYLRDCNTPELKEAKTLFPWKPKRRRKKDWYHHEYLKSDLWKTIKARVLARDGNVCLACDRPAVLVHHKSYDQQVLAGYRDDLLVSLCGDCHGKIEFDEAGKKVDVHEANRRLERLCSR